jgi:uncharacterized protein
VAGFPAVPTKLPLILLPPSEGKATGGAGPPWTPGLMTVDLDDCRMEVVAALRSAMGAGDSAVSRLLGVKGESLRVARAADLEVLETPTLPAIDRYTGVLYSAMDASSLSPAARRRLRSMVLIVSGLWGAVGADDPVPAYRLKMSAALPSLGKLSTWWRPFLTEALADRASRRTVWNLLPKEHDAAWSPERIAMSECYSVRFMERRPDGSLAQVSHWNKFLKGALARHLLESPRCGPDELARWRHPSGYRLDPSLTSQHDHATTLTFVQEATG